MDRLFRSGAANVPFGSKVVGSDVVNEVSIQVVKADHGANEFDSRAFRHDIVINFKAFCEELLDELRLPITGSFIVENKERCAMEIQGPREPGDIDVKYVCRK